MFQCQQVDSTGEGETDCRRGRGRIFRVKFLYGKKKIRWKEQVEISA